MVVSVLNDTESHSDARSTKSPVPRDWTEAPVPTKTLGPSELRQKSDTIGASKCTEIDSHVEDRKTRIATACHLPDTAGQRSR